MRRALRAENGGGVAGNAHGAYRKQRQAKATTLACPLRRLRTTCHHGLTSLGMLCLCAASMLQCIVRRRHQSKAHHGKMKQHERR